MADQLPISDGKEISLLLLGKTGHGKSATGNTILGWEAFGKSDLAKSKTITATLNCSDRGDGSIIRVVDTPGVMDTEKQVECTISEIMQSMSLCPSGFNALLFVIKCGMRYTQEEKDSLDIFKIYFGSNFLRDFGIVVMTQGDSFDLNHEDDNMTFEEWLLASEREEQGEAFDELLRECNNRCVLFYNSGDEYNDKKEQSVKYLFNLIKKIPKIYTKIHVELASKAREELVTRLGAPVLDTGVQEKLSLLIEQIEKDLRNNTFSYQFMLRKIEALNKSVDSVGRELKETREFTSLKDRLDAILERMKVIRTTEEREKQKAEQEQILNDLEALRDTPDRFQIFMRRAFCIFAHILKPIGTVLSFGAAREYLNEFVSRMEGLYNTQKHAFDEHKALLPVSVKTKRNKCVLS